MGKGERALERVRSRVAEHRDQQRELLIKQPQHRSRIEGRLAALEKVLEIIADEAAERGSE